MIGPVLAQSTVSMKNAAASSCISLLATAVWAEAEGKGFEPDGDFGVTADGDCPCDFCQGWRAALRCKTVAPVVPKRHWLTPICKG